ncbi:MAG: inositol monophosphatase family protein [bacterium]|nr:inositol monophosphatase family protein [bacterium]
MPPTLSPGQIQTFLAFARDLAREAGQVTLKYFRTRLDVETKADDSPVTVADRETERLIRRRIEARFPDHGILGEEFGETRPGAEFRWIIDPIDGTKSFIHGVPLYTVLLALEWAGDARVGVIHNPPLDETVAAGAGLGCTLNGAPCRVSACDRLNQARVQCTDYAELMRLRPKFCAGLLAQARLGRTWGDAYGYLLVATGRADVMLDPVMSLWDSACLKPIIQEAGGRFTDLDGHPTIHNPSALATNGCLHDAVLALATRDR